MIQERPIAGGNPRGFGPDEQPEENEIDSFMGESEEEVATEDEQAEYDMIVSRAIKYIHTTGRESILKNLSSSNTPAEGIGKIAARIITQIVKSAKQQGKELTEGILYHAGLEVVEELAEYGAEAGILQFNDEQEMLEQVEQGFMFAVKEYGENGLKTGLVTPEQVEASKSTMDEGIRKEREKMEGSHEVTAGVRQAMGGKPMQVGGLVNAQRGQVG